MTFKVNESPDCIYKNMQNKLLGTVCRVQIWERNHTLSPFVHPMRKIQVIKRPIWHKAVIGISIIKRLQDASSSWYSRLLGLQSLYGSMTLHGNHLKPQGLSTMLGMIRNSPRKKVISFAFSSRK